MTRFQSVCLTGLVLVLFLFAPATSAEVPSFEDVPHDHWAAHYIDRLTAESAIQGYGDGSFRPGEPISREHSALILSRILSSESHHSGHDFEDVTAGMDGYEAIHTLTEMGLFARTDRFSPQRPLTRGEMAKLIVKAFDLEGDHAHPFQDVTGHWSASDVAVLISQDITSGYPDGSFRPDANVSRAEMAAFIVRAMQTDPADYYEEIVAGILYYTNAEREQEGLPALIRHEDLEETAMVKAEDFHLHDYFDHESPVHGDPFTMIRDAGILFTAAGENIAAGQRSAEEVVSDWMDSPGHRANVLDPGFTHIGIGYHEAPDSLYGTYFVQLFLTP